MSAYGQVFASAIATAETVPLTMQNASTGNGNGTLLPVSGYGSSILSVTGTMSGGTMINVEAAVDDTNFVPLPASAVSTGATGTSITTIGDYVVSVIGYKNVRARISNYGGGTVTVKGYTSVLTSAVGGGGGAITSVIPGTGATNLGKSEDSAFASGDTGVFVLGVRDDNGTTFCSNGDYSPLAVDSQGRLKTTTAAAAPAATYMATTGIFTAASSATDLAILNGSSTKTVRILAIYLNYVASGGASPYVNNFYLVKRSSANSGTAIGDSETAVDSNNASPTAVLQHYTANPSSLGTEVGKLMVATFAPLFAGTASTQTGRQVIYEAPSLGQAITLRGTAEGLAVNNNGATVTGSTPTVGLTFVWTEE